jgi:hypothetical protein
MCGVQLAYYMSDSVFERHSNDDHLPFLSEDVKASMFKGKINPKRPVGAVSRQLAKKQVNANRTEEQEQRCVDTRAQRYITF